jgi:hypothetical protein
MDSLRALCSRRVAGPPPPCLAGCDSSPSPRGAAAYRYLAGDGRNLSGLPIGDMGGRDRSRPWVNFAALWNDEEFAAGGTWSARVRTGRARAADFGGWPRARDEVGAVWGCLRSPGVPFLPGWRSSARERCPVRYQDFGDPDCLVPCGVERTWLGGSSTPESSSGCRESCGRHLAKRNHGVR